MKGRLIAFIVIGTMLGHHSWSQTSCSMPTTRSWIHLTETYGFGWDTLWFGFDTSATYGIDSQLCEWELPYLDYQCLFVNIPGRVGLGNGVLRDFRLFSSEAQTDTHRIGFGVNWPTIYTLHWSPLRIRAICDSAVLVDRDSGFRIRLDLNDSVYSKSEVFSNLLIRYGTKQLQTYVNTSGDPSPQSFQLAQNYPNPFNPRTTITYQLPKRSRVTLKVFDVLGREVATLVNGVEDSGLRSAQLDAGELASGIYFCHLTVGGFVQTMKMILQK